MVDGNSKTPRDGTLQSSDVPDEVVTQVGKAVVQIVKLRQSLEASMPAVQSEEQRQALTAQVETAAAHAIGEQGLTVVEYNEVIAAAQKDPDLEERVLVACRAA